VGKDGKFNANWLGIKTGLTNTKATKHNEIIENNIKKGKDAKKVRMSLAEKEHIWRLNKKWVCDDTESEVDEPPPPEQPSPSEEMVPKRLYDELLRQIA